MQWRVHEFDSIDSTNTWVKNQGLQGATQGLVARADFQTAGKGRLDRTWEAPPRSSLLTSILLRPEVDPAQQYLVPVAVALAARAALVRLCGLRPELKWPNDLVVGNAKLGGLLAESLVDVNSKSALVVGLGVNLTWPGPRGAGSTCVRDHAGVTLDPRAVLDLLLEELEHRLSLLVQNGSTQLRNELSSALGTLGQHVRVEGPRDTVEGVARRINEFGRLEIETSSGLRVIEVGDITHLRSSEESTT